MPKAHMVPRAHGSFRDLVKEFSGLPNQREIAAAIWRKYGVDVFAMLPDEWVVAMLAERVRALISKQRSRCIAVKPLSTASGWQLVGGCRVATAGNYWGARWLVAGEYRETRDLTIADLRWLIRDRERNSMRARAQVLFFTTNLNLARRLGAKRLGDLEKKGVALLEVELVVGQNDDEEARISA